jgi:uncharacterized membrane protein
LKTAGEILVWLALPVGVAAATAALYGRYRPLPAFLTGPAICRLEDNGCGVLFRTRDAALLGVPNSLLGLLFYAVIAAGLLFHWPAGLLLAAATGALAMSVFLAFRLIRGHLECRVCWTGHAANALLWVALLLSAAGRG